MAQSIKVLLSFIHGRLEKMRQIGREHGWRTSQGTLKNATIGTHIIDETIDMRFDPTFSQIIAKEGLPYFVLTRRLWTEYAAQKGYFRGKGQ